MSVVLVRALGAEEGANPPGPKRSPGSSEKCRPRRGYGSGEISLC